MASIQNVRLEIVENQGAAAALVSYRIAFNSQDLAQQAGYIETVELIGVDSLADSEDGLNDAIPGSRVETDIGFPVSAPQRRRLIALQGTSLDEDSDSSGPVIANGLARPDEIRARVTLRPRPGPAVTGESETLVLHGLPDENKLQPTPL